MVIRKKLLHPVTSASRPAGAESTSRAKAMKLLSSAYWVTENSRLHSDMRKATKPAVTSPPQKFSTRMAVVRLPRSGGEMASQ